MKKSWSVRLAGVIFVLVGTKDSRQGRLSECRTKCTNADKKRHRKVARSRVRGSWERHKASYLSRRPRNGGRLKDQYSTVQTSHAHRLTKSFWYLSYQNKEEKGNKEKKVRVCLKYWVSLRGDWTLFFVLRFCFWQVDNILGYTHACTRVELKVL